MPSYLVLHLVYCLLEMCKSLKIHKIKIKFKICTSLASYDDVSICDNWTLKNTLHSTEHIPQWDETSSDILIIILSCKTSTKCWILNHLYLKTQWSLLWSNTNNIMLAYYMHLSTQRACQVTWSREDNLRSQAR